MPGYFPIMAQAGAHVVPTRSLFEMLLAGGPLMIPIVIGIAS